MAHMCDFPLNDLTHEFDTLTGGHAVTLPPGSVLLIKSKFMARRLGGLQLGGLSIQTGRRREAVRLSGAKPGQLPC